MALLSKTVETFRYDLSGRVVYHEMDASPTGGDITVSENVYDVVGHLVQRTTRVIRAEGPNA